MSVRRLTVLVCLAVAIVFALVAAGEAAPLFEVKKLTAFDAEASDRFGVSVAVSDDTAVVGGIGNDAEGTAAGAAYIFQRDEGGAASWGEVKKLTASDAEPLAFFGSGVAASGDTASEPASGASAIATASAVATAVALVAALGGAVWFTRRRLG